jgi:hypothetical protein
MLAALGALVFCGPLGGAWMVLLATALALLCCAGSLTALGSAYIFLFLFDNMLPFPPLGGSLARVLQAGILLRAGLLCLRARRWPDRFTVVAALGTAATCGISYALKGLVGDSLSFAVNMAVLLALRLALRAETADLAALLRRWMRVYVASAVTAVCFGLLYNRFYVFSAGVGQPATVRFLGTHEPNFMAMFLDVAVILWLTLPHAGPFARRGWGALMDACVLGVLLGGLALTQSLTGIVITACMLIACGFVGHGRRKKARDERPASVLPARPHGWAAFGLRVLCGLAVAGVLTVGFVRLERSLPPQKISEIYGYQSATGVADADEPNYIAEAEYRALRAAGEPLEPHLLTAQAWQAYRLAHGLEQMMPTLSEAEPLLQDGLAQALRRIPAVGMRLYTVLGYARWYGLDVATSGRWGLLVEKARDFFAEPLWQKLFGRGPDPERAYFPMFQTFGYSHNSYLDLLTGFGVAGFLALLWWLAHTARRRRFFGAPMGGEAGAALTLARIALLLHAATLSMYLNRVFLFFLMG